MDLIPHLQTLAEAGVVSCKIEGRLRTPEYAAVAVAACRAARAGEPYDEALVRDIFSRSGFTDGYLLGRNDKTMFGVRTEADAAATRAAAPRARELYRRELARIPVDFAVSADETCIRLTAADRDGHGCTVCSDVEPAPAGKDQRESITRALGKTGGTPFQVGRIQIEDAVAGLYLPGGAWNTLRRTALEQLLAARSAPTPLPVQAFSLPAFPLHPVGQPAVMARFATIEQIPAHLVSRLSRMAIPLAEAQRLPAAWRARTMLELPRITFGALEAQTAGALAACEGQGWAGVILNNLAQMRFATTLPRFGGMGLNITNPLAARQYAEQGLGGLLIHPETPLASMRCIEPGIPTAALCYGHIPLMLTRACPLKNVRDCTHCQGAGSLRDRKGRDFPVRCSSPGSAGIRTVFNPVPLYMGDRLAEMPVDCAVAAFTLETPARVAQILERLLARQGFDGEFTRGLYYA